MAALTTVVLNIPTGEGVGTASDVRTLDPLKSFVIDGTIAGQEIIVIEGTQDPAGLVGFTGVVAVGSNNPGNVTLNHVAAFYRVRRRFASTASTPTAGVSAVASSVNTFTSLAVPALPKLGESAVGASLDVSALGEGVSPSIAGTVGAGETLTIETSQDGTNWNGLITFPNNNPGPVFLSVAFKFMRCRRFNSSGNTLQLLLGFSQLPVGGAAFPPGDPNNVIITNAAGAPLPTDPARFAVRRVDDAVNGDQSGMSIGATVAQLNTAMGPAGGTPGSLLLARSRRTGQAGATDSRIILDADASNDGLTPGQAYIILNYGTTGGGAPQVTGNILIGITRLGSTVGGPPFNGAFSIFNEGLESMVVMHGMIRAQTNVFISANKDPPATNVGANWLALDSGLTGPGAPLAPAAGAGANVAYIIYDHLQSILKYCPPGAAAYVPIGSGRGGKGPDVAAGGTITLGATGDYAHITGASTTINFMTNSNIVDGQEITFYFENAQTLTHNAGGVPANTYAFQLAGAADAAMAAQSKITFRRDTALTKWLEISRSS